eukprot:m.72357 g.72357  ORF g.72357 m.72357 type:complete len:241 (-) comp16958_c0_seq2:57-779(-)
MWAASVLHFTMQRSATTKSDGPCILFRFFVLRRFWHPWACAFNISGCPWVGHANASRVFNSYLTTVGHGARLNMNIPADRSGKMNASVAQVMADVGRALNDTFGVHVAAALNASGACGQGVVELALPTAGQPFDYVVTMEDLARGQRIMNYSIDYLPVGGSEWQVLVPPVWKTSTAVSDRPDGHDPRDSRIGHKRIDIPVVAARASKVRFNCIESLTADVFVRSFALHVKRVPWEPSDDK